MGPYRLQSAYSTPATQQPSHPTAVSPIVLVQRILPLEPSPELLTTGSPSFLTQPGLGLPSVDEFNLLYHQYWSNVDPLAHIVHKRSFEEECRKYMPHGQLADTAPVSFKALLLAMCLAAAVSLPLVLGKEVMNVSQQTLVAKLKAATEKALADANFMSSVEIQNLQAFTIYLVSSKLTIKSSAPV